MKRLRRLFFKIVDEKCISRQKPSVGFPLNNKTENDNYGRITIQLQLKREREKSKAVKLVKQRRQIT